MLLSQIMLCNDVVQWSITMKCCVCMFNFQQHSIESISLSFLLINLFVEERLRTSFSSIISQVFPNSFRKFREIILCFFVHQLFICRKDKINFEKVLGELDFCWILICFCFLVWMNCHSILILLMPKDVFSKSLNLKLRFVFELFANF